jgi:hypothetical protein
VIQHDGGVCHGDGNADFCCATARAWQHFVAMRKETVKELQRNSYTLLGENRGFLQFLLWRAHMASMEA